MVPGSIIERIRRKAVERGLDQPRIKRLAYRTVMHLRNSFFAARLLDGSEKVTSVSGRGVGMDVVKTNIEKISGTIRTYKVVQV